jgi:predicted GNAT family acetyltransferase
MRQANLAQNYKHRPNRSLPFVSQAAELSRIVKLTNADNAEVTSFLSIRPVHTVVMASFIQDNGMESEHNRGIFYGYRNRNGKLEGVALIGHTTLIETRSDEAMEAFAKIARNERVAINLIMSEHEAALDFWQYYAGSAKPRHNFTELMFETAFPMLVQECEWEVRHAKVDELEQIAEAHAEVAFIESGIDPMVKDREGFIKRVARRVEMGRTYVVFEGDKLVFKADVIAEANGIIYIEGIYVAEELRGHGIGSKCLSKLNLMLLERAEKICLLSNERFPQAHRSFQKAGYRTTARCTTLFV